MGSVDKINVPISHINDNPSVNNVPVVVLEKDCVSWLGIARIGRVLSARLQLGVFVCCCSSDRERIVWIRFEDLVDQT